MGARDTWGAQKAIVRPQALTTTCPAGLCQACPPRFDAIPFSKLSAPPDGRSVSHCLQGMVSLDWGRSHVPQAAMLRACALHARTGTRGKSGGELLWRALDPPLVTLRVPVLPAAPLQMILLCVRDGIA